MSSKMTTQETSTEDLQSGVIRAIFKALRCRSTPSVKGLRLKHGSDEAGHEASQAENRPARSEKA